MKALYTSVVAILVTVTIVGILGTQQIYAPRECGGCSEFKKLTNEFEKNVISALGDPNLSPGPRELLNAYAENVDRLFVGTPPAVEIQRLLLGFTGEVLGFFDESPLEPEEQVKDFRALTHEFEKAVRVYLVPAQDPDPPGGEEDKPGGEEDKPERD